MSTDTATAMDAARNTTTEEAYPPPSLHWGLVLLFWILTGGLFGIVWIYRQAAWVRRIDPSSKALRVLALAFICSAVLPTLAIVLGAGGTGLGLAIVLARVGFAVAWIWSYLSMRQSLEARFDLALSGILTFFFTVFYLQYHMTRIAKGEQRPEQRGLCLSADVR